MVSKITWISAGTKTPFLARKTFTVDKKVRKAVAKVCGLGQFVFYVNGKKVSDHELDPGWTDYRKWIEYVIFDVTDLVQEGENCIGVAVGNGWFIKTDEHYTFHFADFMPPNPNPYRPFSDVLVLALTLTLTYEDGSSDGITADDSFKTAPSPVVMSNVYGSETIDNRLFQPGWNTADFDDSDWPCAEIVPEGEAPSGKLVEQFQPPIRVIHTYEGKKIRTVGRRAVSDFSQNMSAMLTVRARGPRGSVIRLFPAEKLGSDGDVDQTAKDWCEVDSQITLILGGIGEETFRMQFTYFAGRYVGVETEGGAEAVSIQADAITSAWKEAGTFACDDVRYLQVYDLVEKAIEANMVSVHTDCPTIERFAWQEPNHLMAPSIFFAKDGNLLWRKFFADMRAGQHTKEDFFYDHEGNRVYPGDGLVPSQCPCYVPNVLPVPGMGSFYDIIGWGSSSILGVYWHYLFYGDREVIAENYSMGTRYLAHLLTKRTARGMISHGLGDWGNPRGEYARENVETALLYADTKAMARFAGILGKDQDESRYQGLAEEIRTTYNAVFLQRQDNGHYAYRSCDHADAFVTTQACEAMPLFFRMVPEACEEDVVLSLKESLVREGAFVSGEVGMPYIIQAASRYGMNDLIAEFIMREEHPSYYAFVKDGFTTLGEYWEKNPRSHCHDMMGHILEWYYDGIAGIRPLAPGFRKVLVKPYLPATMDRAEAVYHSVSGDIRVSMVRSSGQVDLSVSAAPGIAVTIDREFLGE